MAIISIMPPLAAIPLEWPLNFNKRVMFLFSTDCIRKKKAHELLRELMSFGILALLRTHLI